MEVGVWVFAATCLIVACVVLDARCKLFGSYVYFGAVILLVPFLWLFVIIYNKVNSCFEQLQRTSQNIMEAVERVINAISEAIEFVKTVVLMIADVLWIIICYTNDLIMQLSTPLMSLVFLHMWMHIVFAEA